MAPPCGSVANQPQKATRLLFAFGRMVGFVVFAGAAMAMLGAIVLLPAYMELRTAQYDRDYQKAITDDLEARTKVNERLLAEAGNNDEMFLNRMMMKHFGVVPSGEAIYGASTAAAEPQALSDMIRVTHHPLPVMSDDWYSRTAARLENPSTRRGVFLLSALSIALALFLFSPAGKYKSKDRSTPAIGI